MDFSFTQQTLDIMAVCDELGKKVIEPLVPSMEAGEFPESAIKAMADAGLMSLVVPEEYGGPGCTYTDLAMAMQTLGYYNLLLGALPNLSNNNLMLPLMRYATEEQKSTWIPRIAGGEMCAFALTEPDAGSDNFNMRTRAVAQGDDFIVNGHKCFISDADRSDMMLLFAVTGELDVPKREVSAFLLDRSLYKGITFGPPEKTMGMRGSVVNDIFFDDVRVPKACMLGKQGEGFLIAMTGLNPGRICAASLAIGGARRAVDEAVKHVKARKMFGKTLSAMQNTQFVLADCKAKIDCAQAMVLQAVTLLDQNKEDATLCCEVKYMATEYAKEIIDKCLQLFGGYGYINEYVIEHLYRDIRITTIAEGASEVCKHVIAKAMGLR